MRPPLVKATFDGRKTQTRRLIKINKRNEWLLNSGFDDSFIFHPENHINDYSPYGGAGDFCYIREPVSIMTLSVDDKPPQERYIYKVCNPVNKYTADLYDEEVKLKFTPSIHAPRRTSRLTIQNIRVRAERLHDMTDEDAIAEGIEHSRLHEPLKVYAGLWNSINTAPGTRWEDNPLVWAIYYTPIFKNIDEVLNAN